MASMLGWCRHTIGAARRCPAARKECDPLRSHCRNLHGRVDWTRRQWMTTLGSPRSWESGLSKRGLSGGSKRPEDDDLLKDEDFDCDEEEAASSPGQSSNSTLSNLENLYASFAKQQKQRQRELDAKRPDFIASLYSEDSGAKSGFEGSYYTNTSDEAPLRDAREQEFEEYSQKYQSRLESRLNRDAGFFEQEGQFNPLDPEASDTGFVSAQEISELQEEGMLASWDELPPQVKPVDAKSEWIHFVRAHPDLSPSSDETLLTEDVAPPDVRESFERHVAQLRERWEVECQLYEEKLIKGHEDEVKKHLWILEHLDTSKTQCTAPLREELNPFLYNEKHHLGVTSAEMVWLRTRPKWRDLVRQKRTRIAVANRDQAMSDEAIDELFIDTVNMLANNPACEIHPADAEIQERAFAARTRLQRKLYEIWENHPIQWMDLLNKYLPKSTGIAEKINNREFWNPNNPWLLAAFTRSLIDESDVIEHTVNPPLLEQMIRERMDADRHQEAERLTGKSPSPPSPNYGNFLAHAGCLFCGPHRHRFPLEVMNVPLLVRYMNQAGKILGRKVTGLCKKHQKKITKTIKYARHLNLFTYKNSVFSIKNPYLTADWFGTPTLGYRIYTNPMIPRSSRPKSSRHRAVSANLSPSCEADSFDPSTLKSMNLANTESDALGEIAAEIEAELEDGDDDDAVEARE